MKPYRLGVPVPPVKKKMPGKRITRPGKFNNRAWRWLRKHKASAFQSGLNVVIWRKVFRIIAGPTEGNDPLLINYEGAALGNLVQSEQFIEHHIVGFDRFPIEV